MRRTPITRGRLAMLALVAVAFTFAGCGSSEKNETSASPTAEWIDGFCSALTTWKSGLESAGSTLKNVDELSKAKIEQAATDVSDANDRLAAEVKALGDPPKTAAPEAKDAVEDLRSKLEASAGQIKDATESISSPTDVLKAVNTTSSALLTMSTDISATVARLESLDAADEWKQAFADSEACKSLGKS